MGVFPIASSIELQIIVSFLFKKLTVTFYHYERILSTSEENLLNPLLKISNMSDIIKAILVKGATAMTPIERFKLEAARLQEKKNVLFTAEIRATKTYEDMHTNKGALDAAQSEFLLMVEKYNRDCIYPNPDEISTDEAVDARIAELYAVLEKIANTIYTLRWE